MINPTKMENAYDNLVELGVDVTYAQGYKKGTEQVDNALVAEALAAAKAADVAVVFAGLTEEFEGEGYDRANIEMPANHNQLIEQVAAANPNTVVVLAGGSVIHMPWLNSAKALLNSGLSGQAGGKAVARILTGAVCPSGKTSRLIRCPLRIIPPMATIPASRWSASIKRVCTLATATMTPQRKKCSSRSVTACLIPLLNTAI